MKAAQSFYVDSWVCVWVGVDVSEWFLVNVRLRQGCAMSQWLFNVYMDGVVQEVNARVKVKSSMVRSFPVENLLPQNVGSIINLQ